MAGFGLLILLIAIIVAVAMMKLNTIDAKIRDVTEDRYPKIVLANKISVTTLDIGRYIRNAIIVQTPEETETNIKKVEDLRAANAVNMDQMEKLLSTPKGRSCLKSSRRPAPIWALSLNPCTPWRAPTRTRKPKPF